MDFRKSVPASLPLSSKHASSSSQFETYLTTDAYKMHKNYVDQGQKLLGEDKLFSQWLASIQAMEKPSEQQRLSKLREINSYILTKARENKAFGYLSSLIGDKNNELKLKKTKLLKLQHEFKNYTFDCKDEQPATVIYDSEEANDSVKKQLEFVDLYSNYDIESAFEIADREKSTRIISDSSKCSINKSGLGFHKDTSYLPANTSQKLMGSSMLNKSGALTERSTIHNTFDNLSSSRISVANGKKPINSIEDEVMQILGKEKFSHLRYLFEKYCAQSNPTKTHTMESYQFHKFLQEHHMIDDKCTLTGADLMFCKGNKSKSINFIKFCSILMDMAKQRKPEISSKVTSFELYMRETIFSSKALSEKTDKYSEWHIELEDKDLVKFLDSCHSHLATIFKKYTSSSPNLYNQITLKLFLKFCQDTKVIPDLLSHSDCTLMFKICQRAYLPGQDLCMLTYDEFVGSLCFLSFYYYSKNNPKQQLTYLEKAKRFIHSIIKH